MSAPLEAHHDPSSPAEASIGELLSGITTDMSTLMRQEVALAKAEVQQSAKQASKGVGMFGGAAFAGYMVVLFLTIALWWLIALAVGLGWSALIVAVIWAIIGYVLFSMGRKEMSKVGGLPKTADTMKRIPDALKGNE
jgi:hypothetical protein